MTRRLALGGAAALLFVGLAAPVAATVVVAKDFAALCNEADLIFVGIVTDVVSRWSDPATHSIETLVTFGDLTWLRGGPASTVTLRFGGGEVDGVREEYAGVPHFSLGERRVIFAHDGAFVSPIVGFDQGALRVVDGADGAHVLGAPSAADARGALHLGAPAGAPPSPVPLDAFLDRVRQQLASPTDSTP